MNVNNLIKVKSINESNESTGLFFLSNDEKKSFVIATKHGICNQMNSCEPFINREKHCCRRCSNQFDSKDFKLMKENFELKIRSIYYEDGKDVVLIEVGENALEKLKINSVITSENFYSFGFMNGSNGFSRLVLDSVIEVDQMLLLNLKSDPTPNLLEKEDNYGGMSGSIVFTDHKVDCIAKGLIIENANQNDLIAEDLTKLDFKKINNFFNCDVFDRKSFNFNIKSNLKEYFRIVDRNKITDELELVVYCPKKKGFPHFSISEICNSIAEEFYQVFTKKESNINFLPAKAGMIILKNLEFNPIDKLLSARVAETFLNAPHIYSTSLKDKLYHHTHYLFLNDECDMVISFFCGHNELEKKLPENIEAVILNANEYSFNQNLLLERSFLDQNFEKEDCDKLFEVLFGLDDRIKNFCLVFTISMENYIYSEYVDIDDYIKSVVYDSCLGINDNILKKLKLGLNLHVIIIPINCENEISKEFLKGFDCED